MPWAERSLVRRVGGTAAGAALFAAMATLGVAVVVTERDLMDDARSDALLRAREVASQIDVDIARHGVDLGDIVEDIAELSYDDAEVAVDQAGRWLAGSSVLPRQSGEGCDFVAGRDGEWLVCAATSQLGYHVRVGRPRARILAHRESLLEGGAVVALVVVAASVFAGLVVGRGSLAPLTRLREALQELEVGAPPAAGPTLPRSGLVEIDLVTDTLDRVLARLTRELARSQDFATDAAHELRTPLTKLRTELELLLEDVPGDSTARAALVRLVARVSDLSTLVERLLVLGSPRDTLCGRFVVSLAATVETAVAELGQAPRVHVECSDDGMVRGDATMLSAVVSNGLSNALKFSGGPIKVTVGRDGDRVVLRIDDRGPGIDAAESSRLFRHFVRGSGSRGVPGHGVGLALINHIVAAHGGRVAFVDGPPGAHLVVELPAHLSEQTMG